MDDIIGESQSEMHRRYEVEREKRIVTGIRDYVDMVDIPDSEFDHDPYSEPFERDAIIEETDVVVVGAGWGGGLPWLSSCATTG